MTPPKTATALSPGRRLRDATAAHAPLQLAGTINAFSALLAERAGFLAIYLSGAGVANASYGVPDLGITSCDNVLEDARRITGACELPLLVDADTGWGGAFNIARTVRELERAGAAGLHLEDQVASKRCGHRPGKQIVSSSEMVDRVKAAVDARTNPDFVIMARTDAVAVEGLDAAIDRARACQEAGADMLFPEALSNLDDYRRFVKALGRPVLANITEFGKTPLFTRDELAGAGVSLILYPLSAFRAMSRAALAVYETILRNGTQQPLLDQMQSRNDLYDVLNYHAYEQRLDRLFDNEATP